MVDGKVINAINGCSRFQPDSCFITAHDARTGEELWRTLTIAQPGSPGGDKWGDLLLTLRGGGDSWITGSYDPELGLICWPVAQAKPWVPASRGLTVHDAALYTNATLELDPDDGSITWYFQHVPGEALDLDEAFEKVLVDDREGRKALFTISKLAAYDVDTLDELWSVEQRAAVLTAALTTGGGLVFTGDVDRSVRALDVRTGDLLWETRLGTSAQGFPVTFRAGGEQYIAVAAGVGGGSPRRAPTLLSSEIHYPTCRCQSGGFHGSKALRARPLALRGPWYARQPVNVLMIQPRVPEHTFWNLAAPAKVFGRADGTMAPLGLLTVAAYLPQDFEVRLVDRNVRAETELDWRWADVCFLSLMLAQADDYRRCLARAREHRVPIAVGGPYTSAMPERAKAEADWVCLGESESIMDAFVADLRAGRRGRVYEGGHETDMALVRVPRYNLIERPTDYYVMPLQYSRGCPFTCEFCDIIEIYGRVPRTKTPRQVQAELDAIYATGFRGGVFVVDDNFIGNRKQAELMLAGLPSWNERHGAPLFFFTEASVNLADHPALLDAMEAAGFLFVFLGIETPDPNLLIRTKKHQNVGRDLLARLDSIRHHGIHVIAGFIVGFDGEDASIFETQRAFIIRSGIGIVLLGLLQALPNTQLSRRLQREGRLLEGQTVSLNHTVEAMNFVPRSALTKREYINGLVEVTEALFEPEAFFARITPALLALRKTTSPPIKSMYLGAFARLILRMGVRDRETQRPFWRTLVRVARTNPRALGSFYYDCFHYFHLNAHKHEMRRNLLGYLASPAPDDVLDAKLDPAAEPGWRAMPDAPALERQRAH